MEDTELYALLREKEVLIAELTKQRQYWARESYYRVRQSYQVLAAFLETCLSEAGDSVPTDRIREMATLVYTCSALHDMAAAKEAEEAEEAGAAGVPVDLSLSEALTAALRRISFDPLGHGEIELDIDQSIALPTGRCIDLCVGISSLCNLLIRTGRTPARLRSVAVVQSPFLEVQAPDLASIRKKDDGPGELWEILKWSFATSGQNIWSEDGSSIVLRLRQE
jgi:hypothetical protein